jgi:DNA adenine methylase
MEGFVEKITINDRDRSIYAFWHSVLNKTEQLCEKIENAKLTIVEWKKQKAFQTNKKNADLLDLGFSTFYLNRTNRSGIINAGVMGGIKQTGNYLMDCRFNKTELIQRIKNIASNKKNIRLYKKDAVKLIDKIEEAQNDNIVFYFDPPYYLKASTLYMNHYEDKNHKKVSDKIKSIQNIKWIVSYDNVPEIQKLYAECPKKEFSFKHTAYEIREGNEIMFFSDNIEQPEIKDRNPLRFKLKRGKTTANIVYK